MAAPRLTFREEFAWVVSVAARHWVPDHAAVLQDIAASLKPGGRMLLDFGGRGNGAGVLPWSSP